MKKIFIISSLIICFASISYGADICVTPSGTGSKGGSDWNNAADWSTMSFVRGNTYYLADGSYSAKVLDTTTSGTTYITIKKATASGHVTDTGWSSTMGDGQASFTPTIKFKSNYWVFDGVTGGGPGSWSSGFGFLFSFSTNVEAIMFSDKHGGPSDRVNVSSIIVRHVEIDGQGPVAGRGYAFDATAAGTHASNITVQYVYVHDVGGINWYWAGASNVLVEYLYEARNESSATAHGSGFRMQDCSNFTIRNSIFEDIVGTGTIGGYDIGVNNVFIYGNVFKTTDLRGDIGNGIIYSVTASGPMSNWKIYNNTFVHISRVIVGMNNSTGGIEFYNNLLYDITYSGGPSITGVDSRGYNYYSSPGGTFGETVNPQNGGTTNPLVNWQAYDFRLKSATNAGTQLAFPYNADPLGNLRGQDGVWDRGAYENVGTGTGKFPIPPRTINIQ